MNQIADILKTREPPESKAKSERAALLEAFLTRLNAERRAENERRLRKWQRENPERPVSVFLRSREHLRELTAARLGWMLAHVKTMELYEFKSRCEQADSFGKCFFGSLKAK